jgi:hypothetical protein
VGVWSEAGYRTYTLTFQVAGAGYETDALGNEVPKAGSVTVTAKLKASGNPQLIAQLGRDGSSVVLSGRLDEPTSKPANLVAGSEAPLTLDGMPGVFRLWPSPGDSITAISEALGERIVGGWRSTA